jgi:hypothetical protein
MSLNISSSYVDKCMINDDCVLFNTSCCSSCEANFAINKSGLRIQNMRKSKMCYNQNLKCEVNETCDLVLYQAYCADSKICQTRLFKEKLND